MRVSTPIREHVSCGLHSGIPVCCIVWYLTGWRALGALDRVFGEHEDFGDGIVMTTRGLTVSYGDRFVPGRWYIPCPVCVVRGRRIELAPCGCDVDARMRGRA